MLRSRLMELFLSLVLILSLGWMLFGVHYKFISDQKAIRKEIKQRIKQGVPESDLHVFDLNHISCEQDFFWVNDHEFRKGEQLFDIVRKEGNKVFCINDTQEELLFRNLDELTRKTASAKGGMKKSIFIQLSLQTANDWKCSIPGQVSPPVRRVFSVSMGHLPLPFHPPCV